MFALFTKAIKRAAVAITKWNRLNVLNEFPLIVMLSTLQLATYSFTHFSQSGRPIRPCRQ